MNVNEFMFVRDKFGCFRRIKNKEKGSKETVDSGSCFQLVGPNLAFSPETAIFTGEK